MEKQPSAQWQPPQPEKRRDERRQGEDRREMIRFEPDKNDRRTGGDRRQTNRDGWGRGKPI